VLLSVVTRTYRRPLLLARAARSIGASRVGEMEWLVVDDDADIGEDTRRIAAEASLETGIPTRTLCSRRRGRTAAANLGLVEAAGHFIHFHDDDDTVEPDFYRTVLDFFAAEPSFGAARVMCSRIYEELSDNAVRFLKRQLVYPERRTVSLLDAAEVFAYPPIGSVFDRRTLLDIGGFDEHFDVGEDYEMLLRFLVKADMGTIPRLLASVHVRQGAEGAYANSPIERRFEEEQAAFVNAMLRRDLDTGKFGLGALLALGRLARRNRGLIDYLDAARKRFSRRLP